MRNLGLLLVFGSVMWMAACGGGNSSSSSNPPPPSGTNNVQAIVVDAGPQPQTFIATNEVFTSVTVCVPGSSQCQTIDHVLVDTGSEGLRVLSSVLTLSLPQENDSSGRPLDECLAFADGYVWGPVATADISMAGEKASSAPIQVIIPSSGSPPVPGSCSDQNPPGGNGDEGDSVTALGANAIIGVGLFQQDCGLGCTSANQNIPDWYFECTSSGCTHTYATLQQQLQNPVSMFATDNNGVLLELPAVPNGGSASVNGSMIFGIGTQSNNALGSATVYQVPDNGNTAGDIITTFNGQSYNQSFIDSGSNGLFFLDSGTTGIQSCSGQNSVWYCPSSPDSLTASNQGQNSSGPVGSSVPVNFTIENANSLFSGNNTAFSTLGGPNPGAFDWGLPFFFGRSVFTAIENKSTPGGTGPYFAY